MEKEQIIREIEKASRPFTGPVGVTALVDAIGEARIVLLGEASHGTHEYYTWRSRITKRLISEKGFSIIAVEGDWPDCYRLNRYIKGYGGSGGNAKKVLSEFNRWPGWLWANWETVAFAEWLRRTNSTFNKERKSIGFYGLDVYSLWESMEAILVYLKTKDPATFQSVQRAMDCFEPFNLREGFSSGKRGYGLSHSCEKEVVKMLTEIRQRVPLFESDPEAVFNAAQNAQVSVNAERYYTAMLSGRESAWNIRDRHMAETAGQLLDLYGPESKIIIWEHNTHIGDARATDMAHSGLVNSGQLLKEQYGSDAVYSVGFGSYQGDVVAASHWGADMQVMQIPPAKSGSWEQLLHQAGASDKLLFSKDLKKLDVPIGHRAIGVVYDPDYEYGNYVPSSIPERYEAFVYLDQTTALHPLRITANTLQIPETYPFGV